MSEKEKGLYQKYDVLKLENPSKQLDCIVLEFDDPIARVGISAWCNAMYLAGYTQAAAECQRKLKEYESFAAVKRVKASTISMTCSACPTQWEGTTDDGKYLYIRYRWGQLSVSVDHQQIYSETKGDGLDGRPPKNIRDAAKAKRGEAI